MPEAISSLTLAETGSKKEAKASSSRSDSPTSAFPRGMEWEILEADTAVLLGLTQALSESYTGYVSCMCVGSLILVSCSNTNYALGTS